MRALSGLLVWLYGVVVLLLVGVRQKGSVAFVRHGSTADSAASLNKNDWKYIEPCRQAPALSSPTPLCEPGYMLVSLNVTASQRCFGGILEFIYNALMMPSP